MACNSAGAGGGCYKDSDESCRPTAAKTEPSNGVVSPSADDNKRANLCLKCKTSEATVSSAAASGGSFCAECFRANLYGKFKYTVASNGMISPRDKVLVAFSGGTSSRVALQFVHEMQLKSLKNFDASRDRSLPVFSVGVAFIDESAFNPAPSHDVAKAVEEMKDIVKELAPPAKELHVLPVSSVYSSGSTDGRDNLYELLNTVTDATGKEDLLVHLRLLCLQKLGIANGYTKIVLGSCTSRIACHVLTATVKGQGYALAADIQYVDARWEIPVVLPLRDCQMKELRTLCSLDSLKTLEVSNDLCAGINGLVSSFVKLLQEENPSRECTIVRTAGKLTPFLFNRIPEADDCSANLSTKRHQKKFNLRPSESLPPESLCPICRSPLISNSLTVSNSDGCLTSPEEFGAACCSSCQFQIIPKETSSKKRFYSLLPQPIIERAMDASWGNQRWLREQIQDCLLSDCEGGS